MIKHARARRALALLLLVLGGMVLFLVPEDFWIGTLLLVLAVALEVVGAGMQRGEDA